MRTFHDSAQRRVALVQRYIPHYRLPLFQKLHNNSRHSWRFFCDRHPGGDFSGLAVDDLGNLEVFRIRNRNLIGSLIFQTGVNVSPTECDVVMVDLGWPILSNPILLSRARRKGIATIGWSKGVSQAAHVRKSPFRRALERWLTFHCDAIVAYGQMSRDYFVKLGFPSKRVFVAQNAVDTARIARERAEALAQAGHHRNTIGLPKRPVVGFLGKVAAFKAVDRIVSAYERARDLGMDAVLVLSGKGPGRSALESQIAASRYRTDIFYVPEVPAGAEAGYFQLFDLYTSFSQGGLGILEAMAHGRPVLSTPEKFPETELLEDNLTAFLSCDFEIESFARRMRDAIQSPEKRLEIGRTAEQRVLGNATQELMVTQIDAAVNSVTLNPFQGASKIHATTALCK